MVLGDVEPGQTTPAANALLSSVPNLHPPACFFLLPIFFRVKMVLLVTKVMMVNQDKL